MKEYKETPRTIVNRVVVKTVCDFCGKEIPRLKLYEVSNIKVSKEVGKAYPDALITETHSFDCCENCFDTKIAPLSIRPATQTESY